MHSVSVQMIFNPKFSFDTPDISRPVDAQISLSTPIPITRLVDTLIETYRKDISSDENVDIYNKVTPPEFSEGEGPTEFTDVVRERSNCVRKKKNEPDKFNFARAVSKYKQVSSFMELKLAKPLLKSLTEMSLDKPTPIQCACIPVALLHHDICACARTGSGKTLAFLLPILERLAKKPSDFNHAITRALVISPTRELAVQIFNVAEKLVKYCPKLRIQLAAGGLDLHSQEAALRLNPDLVIATPGRLIDHLSNAPSFNLQHIEYLVLDEADKLLDEYFTEQIGEIIKFCSTKRQTLLFSATMTESVKELAVLSLRDPVQIFLNQTTAVAEFLHQEFVRIRPHRENDRQAIVVALLMRYFRKRTIVFLPTKKDCHRMHIMLGLLGLPCAELHGNMTQAQRLEALQRFSNVSENDDSKTKGTVDQLSKINTNGIRPVDILLATDLASRGLDIPSVQTVINYTLPQTMKQYVHRVGRTARYMNVGRAVSLVGEDDRKVMKEIMKEAPYPVKARVIAPDVIASYQSKITRLEPIIGRILATEAEERELRAAQSQLLKAEELVSSMKSETVPLSCVQRRVDWFIERKRNKKTIGQKLKVSQRKKRKTSCESDSE
ncbi:putative ATP-dependent RNA helicase DDX27 [Schistosoma japonicum]|nr:putative ATP-dependent RNA helicase DDX27 [Schistosoma japonicum]KAH8859544.1 putative ATP-dependent RNA helicase DDX27 [Schistosoma japonicum]KAH8859545.1 putative ATP-dependent RNA helicase DDX27 [Schistosoma japonicum]KAH8859546.1 putative ATP-dependent RNA helicase DDX27 [Schistosoma japonicum]KAH8859547.1 putative ATP-dependent RNA helicase DDX27 [Schistosoma japonicum]